MAARSLARYFDPDGEKYGIPTYPLHCAPDGLATRKQLRARGLRPGGQDIAAQVLWRWSRGLGVAYLYRIDRAKPVRPMTPARWRAHEAMMRPRRTCPRCGTDAGYVIRTSRGACEPCIRREEQPSALPFYQF
ncbi:RRQRL motif-containing zinc-binding protein [Streptomyces sp. NPDC021622]|uniref:RRQRL motif-containing zinc-binding protein n=1 Tax=Streptomyces sp. NPDC021622 TaxID=3155013 RepID=UPI0033C932A7